MDAQEVGSAETRLTTVGLIGLGNLGAPIAEQLLAAGTPLMVHDQRVRAMTELMDIGADAAASPAELAEQCETVLVCVQTDEQCRAVLTGSDGVLAGSSSGDLVVLLSTVHPDTVGELAHAAAERGVSLVEAPVTGQGARSVRNGSAWVLLGGDEVDVARAEPVLSRFAGRVLRTGSLGSAAALKVAHNVMVYLSYLAAAEALDFAHALGVSADLVTEVTRASGTLSPQMDIYQEIYERRRTDPGDAEEQRYMRANAALLEKDLGIAVSLAARHGAALPGCSLAAQHGADIYRAAEPRGRRR
jgi:3-hydroxyisobutyrate dehydrogenase